MSNDVYLLDANAIREISYKILSEQSRKHSCLTIDEVIYEVRTKDKKILINSRSLEPSSFAKIKELLDHNESVRKLLKYAEYEGTADVPILAYILDANVGRLIIDNYIVVTEDKGLRLACKNLKIPWMAIKQFELL